MKLPFGGSSAPASTLDGGFNPADDLSGPPSGHRAYRLTRTGGIDTNPQAFTIRAAAFAQTAIASGGTATIVVQRNGTATDNWVIVTDDAAAANAQLTLAQTVGARAEPDPGPDLLGSAPVIAHMVHTPSEMVRDPQLGYDPSHLAALLNGSLRDGSWLAVTVRPATHREQRTWRRWLNHRHGQDNPTHHSISAGAAVATFTAGGPTRQVVDSVLQSAKAGMPGFDLTANSASPAGRGAAVKNLALGLAAAAASIFLPGVVEDALISVAATTTETSADTGTLTTVLPLVGLLLHWVLIAAAAALGVPAVLRLAGVMSTEESRLRAALDKGSFPSPARRHGHIRAPREASMKTTIVTNSDGSKTPREKHIRAFAGDYPLHRTSFLLGASVWAGIASPHASAGAITTVDRRVPPAMTTPIGPLIGHSDGTPVYLDASMMTMGTVLLGRPGSGKSVTVRSLFGWSCMERVNPSSTPGSPGASNTLIAFENKGDGMHEYVAWANTLGDKIHTVDVMDPTAYAIDLFDVPGTIGEKASFFADAMKYAFGEDAIGPRSIETLRQVLTAGQAVNDELIATINSEDPTAGRVLVPGHSPVYWAHVLLGGYNDSIGVTLYNAIRSGSTAARDAGTPNENLDAAVDALAQLYDGKTESNRRTFQEAPRSKTGQLLSMERWFTPRRTRISWDYILQQHQSVVINTGSSTAGIMDDSNSTIMSSMIMYSLRRAIQRNCSRWESQHRSVSIFADELALLAGTSPDVVGWFRDQGRSFGIRAVFATQRPEQLGPMLRNNLYTYSTLISYAQNDVNTAREIALNMGQEWSSEDLKNLQPYHTVIRAEVDKTAQPSFTAAMLDAESDRSAFVATQLTGHPPVPGQGNGYGDPQWDAPEPGHNPSPTGGSGHHPGTYPTVAPSRYGISAPPPPPPEQGHDGTHGTHGGAW
ncbi:type IV secretory system conjugative DNA transfer family protein (plasmid) [Citricoccus nitrophenolicus]